MVVTSGATGVSTSPCSPRRFSSKINNPSPTARGYLFPVLPFCRICNSTANNKCICNAHVQPKHIIPTIIYYLNRVAILINYFTFFFILPSSYRTILTPLFDSFPNFTPFISKILEILLIDFTFPIRELVKGRIISKVFQPADDL